jgi:N-acetylmuramoyl-L-alanine amidase
MPMVTSGSPAADLTMEALVTVEPQATVQPAVTPAVTVTEPAATPLPTILPQPAIATPPPGDIRAESIWHTVQEGESLSLIARRYGTTPQAIARTNRLAGRDRIHVGQRLKIPVTRGPAGGLGPVCRIRHTVKEGEWLSKIAGYYGVSPYKIMKANELTIDAAGTIHPGQVLCIP